MLHILSLKINNNEHDINQRIVILFSNSLSKTDFTKKFAIQIETDLYLDDLARNNVLKSATRRKSSAKIGGRRRQTVSLDRPIEGISNKKKQRNVKQSVARSHLQEDEPTRTVEQAVAGRIGSRRKTVTFGTNSYIDPNEVVVRMDRIRSLANISKSDVPSMLHYRKKRRSSCTENAHVIENANPTTTAQQVTILSPTTTESIANQDEPKGTDSLDDPNELSVVFNNEAINNDEPRKLSVSMNQQSAQCSNQQSPLIDFSSDELSCHMKPTKFTTDKASETQFSTVDILMGLNEEYPVGLQSCIPPQKKAKKPVPNLLPIQAMQTSVVARRRPSLTARYLMAVIDEIDSIGIVSNQNRTIDVTAMDGEATQITLNFEDDDFGLFRFRLKEKDNIITSFFSPFHILHSCSFNYKQYDKFL